MEARPAVLVVVEDEPARDRIGSWLEGAGFDVLGCPGPQAPDYLCLGGRGLPCPLAGGADVVVLDSGLASDAAWEGTAAEELLAYYRWQGKAVVVLEHPGDRFPEDDSGPLLRCAWPPRARPLVRSVQRAFQLRQKGGATASVDEDDREEGSRWPG